jgi:hypothetical protein
VPGLHCVRGHCSCDFNNAIYPMGPWPVSVVGMPQIVVPELGKVHGCHGQHMCGMQLSAGDAQDGALSRWDMCGSNVCDVHIVRACPPFPAQKPECALFSLTTTEMGSADAVQDRSYHVDHDSRRQYTCTSFRNFRIFHRNLCIYTSIITCCLCKDSDSVKPRTTHSGPKCLYLNWHRTLGPSYSISLYFSCQLC